MTNYWIAKNKLKNNPERTYNFEEALGDTIMEKREGVYCALYYFAKELQSGIPEVRMGLEIGSIFETCWSDTTHPYGEDGPKHMPYFNNRFNMVVCNDLPGNLMMIKDEKGHWHGLTITNFLI